MPINIMVVYARLLVAFEVKVYLMSFLQKDVLRYSGVLS